MVQTDSIMVDPIIPVLLFPQHIKSTPSHLPLLRSIQVLLNESYSKTYCAHPELFGTTHLRLADPAQLVDIIGENGFTIVLLDVSNVGEYGKAEVEVIATGSVKDFGDGDVEEYSKWSQNLGGSEWAAKDRSRVSDNKNIVKEKEAIRKYEVTAFAVSPNCQARGLGARVLKEIEWLVSSDSYGPRLRHALLDGVARVDGIELKDSDVESLLEGVDLNKLKEFEQSIQVGETLRIEKNMEKPKLVLMGIKELGNEAYYQRRGFKSVWTGTLPVGMWDCKKECSLVYMEKDI
jgi:hypothetical protein